MQHASEDFWAGLRIGVVVGLLVLLAGVIAYLVI